MEKSWYWRLGLVVIATATAVLYLYPNTLVLTVAPPDRTGQWRCEDAGGTMHCIGKAMPRKRGEWSCRERAGKVDCQKDLGWIARTFRQRISPGLDLRGGMRLMYEVEVEEAIADQRDSIMDDLRTRLASELGLHHGDDSPSQEVFTKLSKRVTIRRRGAQEMTLKFTREADAEKISGRFLERWKNLQVLSREGGTIALRLADNELQYLRDQAVDQAVETISNRIDELGLRETSVTHRDEDIVVEVPGASERDFLRIKDIISRTARLEFLICDDSSPFLREVVREVPLPSGITLAEETNSVGPGQTARTPYLKASGRGAREKLNAYVQGLEEAGKIPDDHTIVLGQEQGTDERGNPTAEQIWMTYYLYERAEVTGDSISNAQVAIDQQDNTPYVALEFNPRGAEAFEHITERNVQRRFAIVLDNKVDSAPVIKQRIAGGRAQITLGGYKDYNTLLKEASDLVVVLRAGALPAPIRPINEQRIGPSLGADGIRQGATAMGVGTLLVYLFMLVYYRVGGIVAVVGVTLNLMFLLAIMSGLSATLTLPGLAGVVLTVGMAVDANVIIAERIREELRSGKSPRAAVDAGYGRAFWTIFDSNVTTVIAAVVLMQYGTGPIKGFAVTLAIGILSNMFTGVFCTRVLFDYIVRSRKTERLAI
ncbi:MAG: protein translocase subunit SecD [Deltaproteobacteria bacterium]|nr:protein translocase subunit SecD [Deltaproteobacteria bacterium]